jgi:peroxiredoxin Q/BCP
MLEVGQSPESFTLPDQQGAPVAWSSLRGRPVVFFFYPKASTPGCTQEACAFRDLSAEFEAAGARVFGVSADSVKRQAGFATKFALGMPLLSDPDRVILGPWGVWGEKKLYGKAYEGIVRSTFLFDGQGVARRIWRGVRVAGHAEEVLAAVREFAG